MTFREMTSEEVRGNRGNTNQGKFISVRDGYFHISSELKKHIEGCNYIRPMIEEEGEDIRIAFRPIYTESPKENDVMIYRSSNTLPGFCSTPIGNKIRSVTEMKEGSTYRFDAEWIESEEAIIFEVHNPVESSH